jgi:hypothetical protein
MYSCNRSAQQEQQHTQEEKKPLTFMEEEQESVKFLLDKPGSDVLQSIPALELFSYVSGYYPGGHSFPVIFYDPSSKRFVVSSSQFQLAYTTDKLEQAFKMYTTAVLNKGYKISDSTEVVDNRTRVSIDGEEKVVVALNEIFPDPSKTKTHFSEEQYDFIYSKLDGWGAFSYLAGVSERSGRDYPLIVTLGYQESAHYRVLGKGMAEKFEITDLGSAFKRYKEYIERRP